MQEDVGVKLIRLDLYHMGFATKMVDALLEHEDVLDAYQGVELLVKSANGWVHKFVKSEYISFCAICGEVQSEHL